MRALFSGLGKGDMILRGEWMSGRKKEERSSLSQRTSQEQWGSKEVPGDMYEAFPEVKGTGVAGEELYSSS